MSVDPTENIDARRASGRPGSPSRPETPVDRHIRWGSLAAAVLLAGAGMAAFEWFKQILFPHLTLRASEIMTICMGSFAAGLSAHFVVRRYALLLGMHEEAKRRLAVERNLLRTVSDTIPDSIFVKDTEGRIVLANKAFAKLHGTESTTDLLGKSVFDLFPKDIAVAFEAEDKRIMDGEPMIDYEHSTMHGKEETRTWRLTTKVRLIDKSGKVGGVVVVVRDITRRKQAEAELRLARKMEAVGGLAAGIAHEINTPIQFIGDNTRFLQDAFRDALELFESFEEVCREAQTGAVKADLLQEVRAVREKIDWDYVRREIPKALDQMVEGLGRVATIVRAMKEFSHVDRSAEKTPADLNKALESTLVVARNELKYVADVEVDYGELPLVVCHLGDLNQVFLNLLINAAHAIADAVKGTDQRGRIGVRTKLDGEWVEVAISDSGTGIPEAIREKVFDPFFTTKEVGKGTGQGLALARSIVVGKHGGVLTFDTENGSGTTFYVRLPVNETAKPQEAVAAIRRGEGSAAEAPPMVATTSAALETVQGGALLEVSMPTSPSR
jgi:PAS domain S-box-containing protein